MASEVVPPIPERRMQIDRLIRRHLAVLNKLEPHLGCAVCYRPLDHGRCEVHQNSDGSLRVNERE